VKRGGRGVFAHAAAAGKCVRLPSSVGLSDVEDSTMPLLQEIACACHPWLGWAGLDCVGSADLVIPEQTLGQGQDEIDME